MLIFFRPLLCFLVINTLFSRELWTLPRSSSFHHVLEFVHIRMRYGENLSDSNSFSLSSILPFVSNETTCHNDLSLLITGFSKREKWALKIVDSWGMKPPVGLLEGSHLWLGSYDECLHELYSPMDRNHVHQPYSTKYCTLSNQIIDDDDVLLQIPALIIGICLPESCQSNDIQLKSLHLTCPSDQRGKFPIGAIFTLSLIILLSLFVCFSSRIPCLNDYSVITSLKKIFSLKKDPSTYSFLNGIRVLSLFWIILGHSFVFQLILADNIIHVLDIFQNSYAMQLLLGAIFGVDTFFFISGFLSVFVLLNTFKDPNKFHWSHLFFYYLHRYYRLIPTLIFVLLISLHLTPWMGQGPIYPTVTGFEISSCRYRWWTTLFFLNNIITPDKSCLPVTWYIANDFQYHLLAPILIIPFIFNRRRLTYGILLLLLLINVITTISIISTHPGTENGISSDGTTSADFFKKVYVAPWCRIGPFLIGMITKLILEYYHSPISFITKIICTIISIILAMICIYFPFYSNNFPKIILIIYQSISHQCWALAIGWLIFICSLNQGGLVNKILSWPFWTIIARLSYSAYLIHTIIILVQVYNRYSTIHYQTSIIINTFLAQTIWTLFLSIFVVILVEIPCQIFEKQIRKYHREKKQLLITHSNYEAIN